METEKTPEKIDLSVYFTRFFRAFRKLWLMVVLLAVLGAGVMFLREKASFRPQYEANAVFSITSGYAGDDIFTNAYYYDTAAAKQLVSSFPNILSTDIMRDMLMAYLDTSYINGIIRASAIADTNLLQLTVTSTDPRDAYEILCAVIECYPQVMVYSSDDPQMIIRQNPVLPESPVNHFDGIGALTKGGLLGMGLGFAILLGLSLLAGTVADAEGLKKLVNLPLLAQIPHVEQKKRRKGKRVFLNAQEDPNMSEALRGLRTRVRKQLSDRGGKVVLLTSTAPAEGKSTISANLALSLAAEGNRVVLVDADLRDQCVYKMIGGGQGNGGLLSCLKNSKNSVLDALTQVPETNLYYLSGQSTNQNHYSIDSKAMTQVLEELAAVFDYIVMDSAPCAEISDAALLARFADCVLYVVKQDYANELQILDAVTDLYERDINLSGCVLNDIPLRRIKYGCGKKKK